jgi:hypothetical protein
MDWNRIEGGKEHPMKKIALAMATTVVIITGWSIVRRPPPRRNT